MPEDAACAELITLDATLHRGMLDPTTEIQRPSQPSPMVVPGPRSSVTGDIHSQVGVRGHEQVRYYRDRFPPPPRLAVAALVPPLTCPLCARRAAEPVGLPAPRRLTCRARATAGSRFCFCCSRLLRPPVFFFLRPAAAPNPSRPSRPAIQRGALVDTRAALLRRSRRLSTTAPPAIPDILTDTHLPGPWRGGPPCRRAA